MWIKRTSVKTKNGSYTYIQLVQSILKNGKTHHKVVANLGRMDRLNMDTVMSLVKSISTGISDSLSAEEISLLPVKRYGEILLLSELFEIYRVKKFLTDLSIHKKLDITAIDAAFALIAYYSINDDEDFLFYDWLNKYQLPNNENINNGTISSAFELLNDVYIIREGLKSIYRTDTSKNYNYINLGINNNLKDTPKDIVVIVSTTDNFIPVNFLIRTLENYILHYPFDNSDIFICDNIEILEKCKHFDKYEKSYICRIKKTALNHIFYAELPIIEFINSEGYFEPYNDVGYRYASFENKTVILIRPSSGHAEQITQSNIEPRDVLVANFECEIEKILQIYFYNEKIQNYFFNVFLPYDLRFLYKEITSTTLRPIILNLYFFKYFFFDSIDKRVSSLNITANDVLNSVSDIVSTEILYQKNIKQFHSEFTDEHIQIFNQLGFNPHPVIDFNSMHEAKNQKTTNK